MIHEPTLSVKQYVTSFLYLHPTASVQYTMDGGCEIYHRLSQKKTVVTKVEPSGQAHSHNQIDRKTAAVYNR